MIWLKGNIGRWEIEKKNQKVNLLTYLENFK